MKYYVAIPSAHRGIAELEEHQVRTLPGNRLEYRLSENDEPQVADSLLWSTRRADVVRPAFGLLIRAEKLAMSRLEEIRLAKEQLMEDHPELSHYENQPLFKETNF